METMSAEAAYRLVRHLNSAVDALSGLDFASPSPHQIGTAIGNIKIARDDFLAYAISPVRIEPVAPALDVAA